MDLAVQAIKDEVASRDAMGVPRPLGEYVLFTDASDVAGAGSLFQWQFQSKEQLKTLPEGTTTGVNRDGTLRHSYDEQWVLVPIGHWGWKWSAARKNYSTYERELLAGVLVLSSQYRILNSNPTVWLTDQKSLESFLTNAPPASPRLQRWWVFLSQNETDHQAHSRQTQ